jgi:hypothetical protein
VRIAIDDAATSRRRRGRRVGSGRGRQSRNGGARERGVPIVLRALMLAELMRRDRHRGRRNARQDDDDEPIASVLAEGELDPTS